MRGTGSEDRRKSEGDAGPVGTAIVSVLATLWTADDRAQTITPARDGLAAEFLRYVELLEWCRPSIPLKRHRTLITGVAAERSKRTS